MDELTLKKFKKELSDLFKKYNVGIQAEVDYDNPSFINENRMVVSTNNSYESIKLCDGLWLGIDELK